MQTEPETNTPSLFWKIPLVAFLLFVPFSSRIDIATSSFFLGGKEYFQAPAWCWTVYRYGLRPGQFLLAASAIVLVIGLLIRKNNIWKPALYLSLTLCIGSGVIGHGLLKRFWQRPRPKQVTLFGGKYPFCPIYTRYTGPVDRHLRSLPSGHATMGFYFFSLYFLGRRGRKRWLKITGLSAAAIMGTILAWARLSQGGHYLSDIVTSALIMWLTALWLDVLFAKRSTERVSSDVLPHAEATPSL